MSHPAPWIRKGLISNFGSGATDLVVVATNSASLPINAVRADGTLAGIPAAARATERRVKADTSIEAVVFDLDGLLLDSERVYLEAFNRTRAKLDLTLPADAYLALVGLNLRDLQSRLEVCLPPATSADVFLNAWNREIAALFQRPVPLKPGVAKLCEHLFGIGTRMAVATSSDAQPAFERIERAGLTRFFSAVVGGDQVKTGKPAPDIYVAAARRLGAAPSRTAAFEDSELGVRAALAAGLTTVQVPDLIQPAEETRRLGHIVAPDIISGARSIGLF